MFERNTTKVYYQDRYLASCYGTVVKIGADHVELDRTVAFPDGGGQEADSGEIVRACDGTKLRFVAAKKIYSAPVHLDGMPDINVGGVIWHFVHPEDLEILSALRVGDEVLVRIDTNRRERLSLSHTASHLLYLAVQRVRPDAVANTLGCHIKQDAARFDFGVHERFQPDQIESIAQCVNGLVAANLAVEVFPHDEYLDARYWRCQGSVIPCGGTHVERTGMVGEMVVKRRGLGAGKERLSCEFPQAEIDLSRYRDEETRFASSDS